ncbi:hypothetical protein [Neorhizobium alkalisoli]|uniref:Uncharacterized protein n=1 Tax=Neorhizobium alkalisoli TaxID=528178 RepID=A0A561R3H4_9HYPH|nr:hypothetical protein [Neorhizobium alkalisoli]TWF57149.1 hypothetical protein FHW37_102790 [Neorhizobium alkalisoli]
MKGYLNVSAPREQRRPMIGVMLPGTNAVEIFAATVEMVKEFDFLIYLPNIDGKARAAFDRLEARFTTDISFFILNAAQLDVVLTFGCLPHVAHGNLLLLTALMREIGVTVLDIQHGLYQWGINFTDDSREQGYSGTSGISMPISTLADQQITWAGVNGIGYPRYKREHLAQPQSHAPILVATNTNWHIYGEEDRYRFRHILRQLFCSLPRTRFIWKPHPAEWSPTNPVLLELINAIRAEPKDFPNVTLVGGGQGDQSTLTELIGRCRAGIATVGTAVIDFEMLRKPCAIFECGAVSSLNAHFVRKDQFGNLKQLLIWLKALEEDTPPPVTGQLVPFDQTALVSYISEAVSRTSSLRVSSERLLPILMRYQRLACC